MDDLWTKAGRVKPKALDYESIMDGSFVPPPLRTAASAAPPLSAPTNGESVSASADKGFADGAEGATASNGRSVAVPSAAPVNAAQLKDQRELSVKENLELFIDR
jgi:ubiquitin-like 1-activating enzyme E1 B